MISVAELEEIRKKKLDEMSMRNGKYSKRVVVGMATCGIAAGARPVMNAFAEELKKRNIGGVNVTMTGCIGACRLEPMADVYDSNGSKVTYVKLTPEKVARIVNEHIVNGRVCLNLTIDGAEDVKS